MTKGGHLDHVKSSDSLPGHRSLAVPAHGITVLGLAMLSSYFAFVWGGVVLNPADVLAPLLFWYGVAFLLFAYPLRRAFADFSRYIRTVLGAGVFAFYMVIHVLLYGFLLEGILGTFGRVLAANSVSLSVSTTVFAPPSPLNALLALWYNPWITLTIPPSFETDLSLYSLVIAAVIDVLIVANIGKTRDLGRQCPAGTRSRSMVAVPALGIAFGASCCLSAPLLFTIVVPSAAALSSLVGAYDVTYFLFPPFAVLVLYLNLVSVDKIRARVGLTGGEQATLPQA